MLRNYTIFLRLGGGAYQKMKNKKRVIIIIGIIIILIISIFLIINKFSSTGKSVQQIKVVPLSSGQREKVTQFLLSSEFTQDMPKKQSISLRFFDFKDGKRIWQDSFLIGKNQILSEGDPAIYLILHSKYISELNQENLCDVIKKAKVNGDLGFYSEYNKARLLIKYASLLKHRKCFGF